MGKAKQEIKKITATQEVSANLRETLSAEIAAALPDHISVKKFTRVAVTAIHAIGDEKIGKSDKKSLYSACLKCAADGLIPDGREAALVSFWNSKKKHFETVYMPMRDGLLKKIRNSGQLAHIATKVVFMEDEWEYWIDNDGEHFKHIPDMSIDRIANADKSNVRLVYAVAKTKDGSTYLCPLTVPQIEKARAVSKAKDDGPWVTWWDEQAEKTAIKKIYKVLPKSTDLDDLMHRDDDLNDLSGIPTGDPTDDAPAPQPERRSRMHEAIDETEAKDQEPEPEPRDAQVEDTKPEPEPKASSNPDAEPPDDYREPGEDSTQDHIATGKTPF